MAKDPNLTVMVTAFGAGSVERVPDRDAWRVTGGWLDGVEFDSKELSEAQQSEKKFIDLITRKRQQQLLKLAKEANDAPIYQQYPPSWPGTGGWALNKPPETAQRKVVREKRERDMTDADFAKETSGTWENIRRSETPMWKPSREQDAFIGARRAGKNEVTVRVTVPKPPEPKKVEHEEPPVLRRRYRKA